MVIFGMGEHVSDIELLPVIMYHRNDTDIVAGNVKNVIGHEVRGRVGAFGPFWPVPARFGQFWPVVDSFGPCWPVLDS